ncbi:PspA/IM30 family protein [Haliangium ochraceum]|uniref:Phage shock protein A, PspA n=1 Tax=Haliangium ochraceum (strain DSM 14365 / JCM 11303 / SMP-2) TaxID=502025 RepID=D0LVL1_HALO1|nr:PspA/IM30 family protein [Haliangium ochraceum]ACY17572.1 phage shock protein A, PspA [Haliangium ochraceum DSM 14365]
MAGFWNRMSNLWRGFVSIWVADVEKKHPEIAYENAINSMVEKYVKLKQATAAIIRRRDDVAARLKSRSKELQQIDADLQTAVATNQEDLGMVLIQKKESLVAEISELKGELEGSVRDADSAKASLMQVQSEIQKLKAEKENMMAKMASAQVKVRIQEQLEGLSVDAEVKALDNVRGHIKETIAEANLGEELAESDIDARLRKLRNASGDVTAKSEWEKLKQAAAANAQKTM